MIRLQSRRIFGAHKFLTSSSTRQWTTSTRSCKLINASTSTGTGIDMHTDAQARVSVGGPSCHNIRHISTIESKTNHSTRNFSTSASDSDRSTGSSNSNNNNNNSSNRSNPIDAQNRTTVQQRDYEAFLIGLLHPQHIQQHYFALRSFHIELASIQAKDSSVASMRMSWWHDVIQSLYTIDANDSANNNGMSMSISPSAAAAVGSNPTVAGLSNAIQSHNLTKRFLERMVETRVSDLEKSSIGGMLHVIILLHFRTICTALFNISYAYTYMYQNQDNSIRFKI